MQNEKKNPSGLEKDFRKKLTTSFIRLFLIMMGAVILITVLMVSFMMMVD